MANLRDVARQAGVSAATVSRWLNGSLNLPEQTRTAIQDAIQALNYRPNPYARSLSRGRTDTLCMVVPDIKVPFFAALAAAVENASFNREVGLQLSVTLNRPGREMRYLESVAARHVDGVIFVTNHAEVAPLAQQIRKARRVVVMDEDIPGAVAPRLFCDNHQGGRLAGAHLTRHGHRQIAAIGVGDDMLSGTRRFEGFRQAVLEAFPDAEIQRESGVYTIEDGRRMTQALLNRGRPFTALFAMSDEMVTGALQVFAERGIRVPQDVSVVGFDDILPLDMFSTPITAVRQPVEALGQKAVELLLDTDWDDPAALAVEHLLPVTLIERSSVAFVSTKNQATDQQENPT
ncbi:LacI family DNA-binding transcriptional regulator [Paracoccus mangrovi]|uniref:LacI family DNA-binding transcriptional regulator n=1 Tax=Paracoccus mangrovi TaxID=1715645 RepID=A0ABV7R514_9RHOB